MGVEASDGLSEREWSAFERGRVDTELRTVAARAPVGIFETDATGGCIWVNERWKRIFGLTLAAGEGAGWSRMVHLDDRARVIGEWARAVKAGHEFSTDFRLRTFDERVVWVAWRATPLQDPGGIVRGYLGTVTDITPRIVAQERLEESDQRYRALVEHSADMILRAAPDGTITYVSPACRSLLGYEPEELVGRGTSTLVHEDDLGALTALRSGVSRGPGELRVLHRDGHWVWTEQEITVLRDADGAVIERQGTVRPLEHRKRNEIALRETLRRYRALAENFPGSAAFLFDSELRYQVAAGPALASLGIDGAAVEGLTPEEAFPGERGQQIAGWYREALSGSTRAWREHAASGRPGRIYDLSIGPVRGDDGGVIAGVATVEDVTDRTRGEQELSAQREITDAVARSASLAEILELVVVKVGPLFAAGVAAVIRFESATTGTILAIAPPGPKGTAPQPRSILELNDEMASGRVSRTGEAACIDAYSSESEAGAGLIGRGVEAGAAAPIHIRGILWGAIALGGPAQLWAAPEEIDRLTRFAELIAVAISNAEAWETLARHAATDGVTGLANHRSFQERLRNEVERARRYKRRLSVVMFDLDHFKLINDTYGHQTGDRVLAEAARRMLGQTRKGELVARIGGEEFGWILPETDAAAAFLAAERVRRAIVDEPFLRAGPLTVSAGVCSLADGNTAEDLVQFADRALYRAKDNGRNTTFRYTDDAKNRLAAIDRVVPQFQMMSSIRALARAIDAKDYSTQEHSERVANLAEALAHELGWTTKRRRLLHTAGLLHDVGKIGVPDRILLKPGRLDADEYEQVKRHAALGGQIAADVLEETQAQWVRSHHERWDGTGYPDQLGTDDIPDGPVTRPRRRLGRDDHEPHLQDDPDP